MLLVACGSSGTNPVTGDGGPSVIPDGSVITDAPPGSDDGGSDSAAVVDAGPICYAAGATEDGCRTCCATEHPVGYQKFANETLACACAPNLCGGPDGGIPEAGPTDAGDAATDAASDAASDDAGAGDGGLYGQAVCAATCAGTANPSDDCNTCIYSTLGSVSNLGPCGGTVVSECITDTDCSEYFGCVEKCP